MRRGLGYVPRRALRTRPKRLLLDEPTEGVWVGVIGEIATRLAELASRIGLESRRHNLGIPRRRSTFAG